MLSLITRYVALVAVFVHCLMCGHGHCCAKMCSVDDDVVSVSYDHPLSSHHCHSGKHDHQTDGENPGSHDSDDDCKHKHHSCKCLQSANPNAGTSLRIILSQNLDSLPIYFIPALTFVPIPGMIECALETVCNSNAKGVRLHVLFEHFLI